MTTEQRLPRLERRTWSVTPLKGTAAIVVALVVWAAFSLKYVPSDSPKGVALRRCYEYRDKALEWHTVRGEYPDSLEAMDAPLAPGDEENFVRLDKDPWGNPYVLRREDNEICVCSWGPDGKEGTQDDIEVRHAVADRSQGHQHEGHERGPQHPWD
jgi:hypothetical protein